MRQLEHPTSHAGSLNDNGSRLDMFSFCSRIPYMSRKFPALVAVIALAGCGERASDAFTLYRNSPVDPALRVHFGTFDAGERVTDYNEANCEMAASLFNANAKALNDGRQAFGFWCEPGAYAKTGDIPRQFDAAFPVTP